MPQSEITKSYDDSLGVLRYVSVPNNSQRYTYNYYCPKALAKSGVIKAAPGTLAHCLGLFEPGTSISGEVYFQFFNSASVPANGATPDFICPTVFDYSNNSADIAFDFDFLPTGLWFTTGISWSLSTTLATKTIPTDAGKQDLWIQALFA
jgi:hypothetical protein